jgi:hypothetical protein
VSVTPGGPFVQPPAAAPAPAGPAPAAAPRAGGAGAGQLIGRAQQFVAAFAASQDPTERRQAMEVVINGVRASLGGGAGGAPALGGGPAAAGPAGAPPTAVPGGPRPV